MVDRVVHRHGCGRVMWEYSPDLDRFGTPMALMDLPMWTDSCATTEEGLLFESSATTPYHFIDQAELSQEPSEAMRGLPYPSVFPDVAAGVRHLHLLGVPYFLASSPTVEAQAAADPALELLAQSGPWHTPFEGRTVTTTWRLYAVRGGRAGRRLGQTPSRAARRRRQPGPVAAGRPLVVRRPLGLGHGDDCGRPGELAQGRGRVGDRVGRRREQRRSQPGPGRRPHRGRRAPRRGSSRADGRRPGVVPGLEARRPGARQGVLLSQLASPTGMPSAPRGLGAPNRTCWWSCPPVTSSASSTGPPRPTPLATRSARPASSVPSRWSGVSGGVGAFG